MGIFAGRTGVRLRYDELTFTQINAATAATSLATAKLLFTVGNGGQHVYLDNTLDVRVSFAVTNALSLNDTPGQAPVVTVSPPIFLMKLGANRVINLDQVIPDSGVEAGSQWFVYCADGAPTQGEISAIVW